MKQQSAQAAQASGGTPDVDDENLKQAEDAMLARADRALMAMNDAADDLEGALFEDALSKGRDAWKEIVALWDTVVPFEKTVGRALDLAKGVRDPLVEVVEGEDDLPPELDQTLPWWVEDEDRVAELATGLSMKAQQGLSQLPDPEPWRGRFPPKKRARKRRRPTKTSWLSSKDFARPTRERSSCRRR